MLSPGEIETLKLLHKAFKTKEFICYGYLRKIYRGRYSFSNYS